MDNFYKNKKVLITGHTGFKGMWLCKILSMLEADVLGYSIDFPTEEGKRVFDSLDFGGRVKTVVGDVRDLETLHKVFQDFQPEIVFHLAAQPIVTLSYKDPVGTYSTNVMGTVNLMECIRQTESVRSVVNITTDKVYENKEWAWGYREDEPLNGFDPYSNSKSCSELVTSSYKKSFFANRAIAISTARAGNVIGGGDFSINRIIPDCVRAMYNDETISVRNSFSTRPYQHVLEPLYAYLLLAKMQYDNMELADSYNVGPDECDCVNTGALVSLFCRKWGKGASWEDVHVEGPHEANFLKLDCSKFKTALNWQPKWHIDEAIAKTVEWAKCWQQKNDINLLMEQQINDFWGLTSGKAARKFLVIGNSIAYHGKCSYWHGEWGMGASRKENDYAHLIAKGFRGDTPIEPEIAQFSIWEIQSYDRQETLQLLDKYDFSKYEFIIVQLGENTNELTDMKAMVDDFYELMSYIRENSSPDKRIFVYGNIWKNDLLDEIKEKICPLVSAEYISLKSIQGNEYRVGMGATVYGDDGKPYIVNHAGVALHPNDEAMKYMADELLKRLRA
ncbi:CDP-glucose 4,6-dehydratase [Anaerovibrio sp. RM50]|uniref:CDP-glucose 4,6-dehydratase n=1 Tax=Anaerovibrio sp. RM50 TaxID=1200557 RepID=UPI000907BC9D